MKELSWSDGREWGLISCPHLEGKEMMTYWKKGTPCYDTYTNPLVTEEGDVICFRYDQDEGDWTEDEIGLGEYEEGVVFTFRRD
ncbi:hypothetical protein G4V62_13925 [Bacillaceae bacterium SIJ1]|nr:hypothetical protein [Litoribacterium kuwaitense]